MKRLLSGLTKEECDVLWTAFMSRVPPGTQVRMSTESIEMPDGLIIDEVQGILMRCEDDEEGYNEDFPDDACEALLSFILWIQPFEDTNEWWLDPEQARYLINDQWHTFEEVMA